ncbi:MAG: UDP-N-acetylglucosamine 2-epimerase [Nitrosomonas ureae]
MRELRLKDIPFRYIDSGQHAAITHGLRRVFDLPQPDISLHKIKKDITSTEEAIRWYLRLLWKSQFDRNWLRRELFPEGGICLIHGDTLSTLLGLHMARRAGVKVAHVESGLRSFNSLDPFPEELIRIACMKRADLLFAPSREAEKNLRAMDVRGQVIHVEGNTVADSLAWMRDKVISTKHIPQNPFALATCHRLETITNRHRLGQVVKLFNQVAETMQLIFIVHGPTKHYLKFHRLAQKLSSAIEVKDLMDYDQFITLLSSAQFILSDGGSIQEESALLGKPCLILRNKTERQDGLDRRAVLWKFDECVSEKFLIEVSRKKMTEQTRLASPSEQIIRHLLDFIGKPE